MLLNWKQNLILNVFKKNIIIFLKASKNYKSPEKSVNFEKFKFTGNENDSNSNSQKIKNTIFSSTETDIIELDYLKNNDDIKLGNNNLNVLQVQVENKFKIFDQIFKYKNKFNFKAFLVVTHGGWITEFFRLIRQIKKLNPDSNYHFDNTSINLVRIYCENCCGICFKNEQKCKLKFEIIFQNNLIHLEKN